MFQQVQRVESRKSESQISIPSVRDLHRSPQEIKVLPLLAEPYLELHRDDPSIRLTIESYFLQQKSVRSVLLCRN